MTCHSVIFAASHASSFANLGLNATGGKSNADLGDQDDLGIVAEERFNETVPLLQNGALIDVTLVGDLVGVYIRRFLQQQYA